MSYCKHYRNEQNFGIEQSQGLWVGVWGWFMLVGRGSRAGFVDVRFRGNHFTGVGEINASQSSCLKKCFCFLLKYVFLINTSSNLRQQVKVLISKKLKFSIR